MNSILSIFTLLEGIATLIFFYDRFGHLFYRRKPGKHPLPGRSDGHERRPDLLVRKAKQNSYSIFDDPYHDQQVKSVRLKYIRIEGSGLVAGIILGLSGTIWGFPGYLILGLLGMIVIAFCLWREDKSARRAAAVARAVNEILAITGFVFLSGVCCVVLGSVLGGLLDVDKNIILARSPQF